MRAAGGLGTFEANVHRTPTLPETEPTYISCQAPDVRRRRGTGPHGCGVLVVRFLGHRCDSGSRDTGNGNPGRHEPGVGGPGRRDEHDGRELATTPDAGTATGETAAVVPEALQFTAPLVGGGEFSGAAVADKPTLFWFWAPT